MVNMEWKEIDKIIDCNKCYRRFSCMATDKMKRSFIGFCIREFDKQNILSRKQIEILIKEGLIQSSGQ